MRKIIGIGETVLDILFKNDSPVAAVPGGATFNTVTSLGRTVPKHFPDVEILMVTETGDDHVGDLVVSHLQRNGISTRAVTRNAGTKTHISLAFLDEKNDAHYQFYKDHAGASLSADKVDGIDFCKDDIVIFGSFFAINPVIRDYTSALLHKAREAGAIIYYDINFRPSHLGDLPRTLAFIEENCALSDFVRGSSEDFQCLLGCSDSDKVYNEHIAPLCSNFIMTQGPGSVRVHTPSLRLQFPVEQVETVSTVGAGDNFNAGFIYSILAGDLSREDCSRLTPDNWSVMTGIATRFSAAACRSIYNYVDEGFEP